MSNIVAEPAAGLKTARPSTRNPMPERWSRADGEEDIARVRLGAGTALDAALGQHLSNLRSALHGSLVVVLERRTGQRPPTADPVLRVGDALYLVGPPRRVRAIVGL